jgi:hypothetical protein
MATRRGRDLNGARVPGRTVVMVAAGVLAASWGCSALVSFDDLLFGGEGGGGTTSSGTQLPNGSPCSAPSECLSGACADGVCCNGDCTGCEACDLAGSEGVCSPQPAGAEDEGCPGVCDGQRNCATGAPRWGLAVGSDGDEVVRSLAVDADGSVILSGRFLGDVSFGGLLRSAALNDGFVAKYDAGGDYRWDVPVGEPATGDDVLHDVAVDADGTIVAVGSFTQAFSFGDFVPTPTAPGMRTAIVVILDPGGETLNVFTFGVDGETEASEVAWGSEGDFFVAGRYDAAGSIPGCPGGELVTAGAFDVFVAHFDSEGLCLAVTSFGGERDDTPTDLVVDGEGNPVVAGEFFSPLLNLAGTSYANVGGSAETPNGFVAALASGEALAMPWGFGFGAADVDTVGDLSLDGADVLVAGTLEGYVEIAGMEVMTAEGDLEGFVLRLDPSDGIATGITVIGGNGDDFLGGAEVDALGNLLLSGHSDSIVLDLGGGPLEPGGSADLFVAKLAPDGTHLWSGRYGLGSPQTTPGAQGISAGGLVIGANFRGDIRFGEELFMGIDGTAIGSTDIFVGAFDP